MTSHVASASSPRWLPAATLGWLALAALVSATGRLAALPFPGPQVVVLALTALTIVVGTRVASVRAWLDAIPLGTLVGVHVARYVGVVFLVLAVQGALSPIFAERAGWGDIVAATGALALVLSGPPRTGRRRALYFVWNVIGLLDLVVVVITAAWVGSQGLVPGMGPLLHLPLSLLITFVVPLLIASHVFLFRRLSAVARESRAS